MSYCPIGSCPHCGAPIYAPADWLAVIPPPSQYTCTCRYAHGYQDPKTQTSTRIDWTPDSNAANTAAEDKP
jgi:hypothetical protein